MLQRPDFVEENKDGIVVHSPFGTFSRTNEELLLMEKEVDLIDFDVVYNVGDYEPPSVSTLDLVEMCAKKDGSVDNGTLRSLRSLAKQWKTELKDLLALQPKIEEHVRKVRGSTMEERKNSIFALVTLYVDFPADILREKIQRVESVLFFANSKNKKEGLDLQKAKQYPINSLLKINTAGFARCVWHNEKTPSMKYYKKNNRVHCFGCHKSGDAIDVVQAIRGCSLKDAVNFLNGDYGTG